MPRTRDEELLAKIRADGAIPRHVAIIMDGNGRWARERLMPRPFGHRSGMKSVREVVEGALHAGIEHLSLFAFSQENWQRPATAAAAAVERVVSQTRGGVRLTLNLFISYGGRAEILRAVRQIAEDVRD